MLRTSCAERPPLVSHACDITVKGRGGKPQGHAPTEEVQRHIARHRFRNARKAPKVTFTGIPWWKTFHEGLATMAQDDRLRDRDYIFPAPTRDHEGFRSRPAIFRRSDRRAPTVFLNTVAWGMSVSQVALMPRS